MKTYRKILLNTELVWDRNSLSQADNVGLHILTNYDMVRESNEYYEEWRGCRNFTFSVSNSNSDGEKGACIIVDLVNQIIVKKLVPVKWENNTAVNYYKGKKILSKELTIGTGINRSGSEHTSENQKVDQKLVDIDEI